MRNCQFSLWWLLLISTTLGVFFSWRSQITFSSPLIAGTIGTAILSLPLHIAAICSRIQPVAFWTFVSTWKWSGICALINAADFGTVLARYFGDYAFTRREICGVLFLSCVYFCEAMLISAVLCLVVVSAKAIGGNWRKGD